MAEISEAELLHAVAADIDDRGAWQVYLDWLLEREDPRAELYRLQVEQEDTDDDREKKALRRKIDALLDTHGERWLAGVQARKLPVRWGMRRGVVGHVSGKPAALAAHAEAILAAAPLLTSLGIDVAGMPKDRDLTPLAGSPLLARARAIEIVGTHARVAGLAVFEAPALRALELSMVAVAREDIAAIVRGVPRLERFKLMWGRINKGALEPLAELPATMTSLDLSAAHFGPALGAVIARMPALRFLRIPGNELGSAALAELLPVLGQVAHLDLRSNALGVQDVAPLLAAIPQVTVLKLGGNTLGTEGVVRLAGWPGLQRLVHLELDQASDEGALAIATSEHLSLALVKLNLGGRAASPALEAALLDAPRLANARIYVGMKLLARKKREAALAKAARSRPATR